MLVDFASSDIHLALVCSKHVQDILAGVYSTDVPPTSEMLSQRTDTGKVLVFVQFQDLMDSVRACAAIQLSEVPLVSE